MCRYRLLLHDGPTAPPVTQSLQASTDADALDLAQISLLAAKGYTHAEIYSDGVFLTELKRDSYTGSQPRPLAG